MKKVTNGIFIDICTYLFIFLFLFSNLITRILNYYSININLNILLYVIIMILLINLFFKISIFEIKKYYYWLIIMIVFFIINIFNVTYCTLESNFISTKDTVIPLAIPFIALYYTNKIEKYINYINNLFMIFILYGVIQELIWYKYRSFSSLLPWDNNHINKIIEQGVSNLFQTGGLLRFFGTMNAFVEYQVVLIVLMSFLYLYRNKIKNKVIYCVNFFLGSCFIIFSLERSPIIMFLIIMFILNYKKILNRLFLIKLIPIVIITVILVGVFSNTFKNNPNTQGAYIRLYNVITLNFSNDAAINERKEVQWQESKNIIKKPETFFGLGGAIISSEAKIIGNEYYIAPHNNILGYYIAYGFLGVLLFFILHINLLKQAQKLNDKYIRYICGLMLAYLAMACFNMPYLSKQGAIYFLVIFIILLDDNNYRKVKSKNGDGIFK